MGNSVTLVVRDDFVDNLPQYSWNQLEVGVHDPSYSIRFIETSANDVEPIGNHANGVAISHYEHTTGESVLYIDSNMLFSAPLLHGLTASELSKDNIYLNAKRLSKFIFGPGNAFNVSQPKEHRYSANVIDEHHYTKEENSPNTYVFRYKTDNFHEMSEDKDLLKNLASYIRTGDRNCLSCYFEHITTISNNESILFSMNSPMPKRDGPNPFIKFDAPLVRSDMVSRLRIGADKAVSANKIIASQAILESIGYEIQSTKTKTASHEAAL